MGNDEKNVWKREVIRLITLLAFLLIGFLNDAYSQVKCSKVILNKKKCNIQNGCKSCIISTLTSDTNIFIRQKEGDYVTLRSDAQQNCFALDLFVYKNIISLDSVYYANIRNKELQYIGGFIKGTYTKNGNQIVLSLTFLNAAINSSRTSDHTFIVVYNLKENNVDHIELKF